VRADLVALPRRAGRGCGGWCHCCLGNWRCRCDRRASGCRIAGVGPVTRKRCTRAKHPNAYRPKPNHARSVARGRHDRNRAAMQWGGTGCRVSGLMILAGQ
jgi:hypothetical protein